ncbi:nucleotidyltransferase domain-containing protein [Pyrodictium abyssi]|uniref:Nucleotidyltransferase domain-containing protein n=1 Tax=Pyrodictium abyssi TaxID=54256 RepID=A0ABM8IZJ0_9CREN|nr:nucleotidyltransferase domain-containing protein [Pyrodictium abyssi]
MRQRRKHWKKLLEEVSRDVKRLVKDLEAYSVKVEKVLLFGSIARGDYTEDSDVDLVIVSRDWSQLRIEERLRLLYRLWRGRRDATFVPSTPEELKKLLQKSIVLQDASKYWIQLYPDDDG